MHNNAVALFSLERSPHGNTNHHPNVTVAVGGVVIIGGTIIGAGMFSLPWSCPGRGSSGQWRR